MSHFLGVRLAQPERGSARREGALPRGGPWALARLQSRMESGVAPGGTTRDSVILGGLLGSHDQRVQAGERPSQLQERVLHIETRTLQCKSPKTELSANRAGTDKDSSFDSKGGINFKLTAGFKLTVVAILQWPQPPSLLKRRL